MRQAKHRSPSRNLVTKADAWLLMAITALVFSSGRTVAAGNSGESVAPAITNSAQSLRLVVSLADRKLAVIENNQVVKVYSVAVGAQGTPSPQGKFEIVNRISNPTYYHKGVVIGPGRANPLGNRWMGLSLKGYGIHGTDVPSSIGHAASHGCIRMSKRDVEELFSRVSVGDVVEIQAERSAELFRPAESRPATSEPMDRLARIEPLPLPLIAAYAQAF